MDMTALLISDGEGHRGPPLLPSGCGCSKRVGDGECRVEGREEDPVGGGDLIPRSSWMSRVRSSRTRLRHRCFSRSFHPDPEEEDADDMDELPEVRLAVGAVVLGGEKKASALAFGPGRVRPPLSSIVRYAAAMTTIISTATTCGRGVGCVSALLALWFVLLGAVRREPSRHQHR